VDELLLNESVEYSADGQTETLHYGVLCRNGSTSDLVNKDFNNCADYIEDWERKLFNGEKTGTPARRS
jgi:hypothetical protein